MADADDSYEFGHVPRFLAELRKGAELVMGNRFRGGIGPGAMPPLHRYLGNPVLSFLGRTLFRAPMGTSIAGYGRSPRMLMSGWGCGRPGWSSRARWW